MRIVELNGVVEAPSLDGELGDRIELQADINAAANISADYESLANKPQINGVELIGNKTSKDIRVVSEGTAEYWASNPSYIPLRGEIVIYSDYESVNGVSIAGFKVGDGEAYVADLPFTDAPIRNALNNHINDTTRHITALERIEWNGKLDYTFNSENENLILTTY